MVQNIGKNQEFLNVGIICAQDNILPVHQKQASLIDNSEKNPRSDSKAKRVRGKMFQGGQDAN